MDFMPNAGHDLAVPYTVPLSYYYAVLREDSHIRIGYPIHHFRGREPDGSRSRRGGSRSAADATDFNSVHVKNYVSCDQGLTKTVETLHLKAYRRYPLGVAKRLKRSSTREIRTGSAHPRSTVTAGNTSGRSRIMSGSAEPRRPAPARQVLEPLTTAEDLAAYLHEPASPRHRST